MTAGIKERLFELRDTKYAAFQSRIIPTAEPGSIIGVRVPTLRKLAGEYVKEPEHETFMAELPHTYYEENMLHGLLIDRIKDYDECIAALYRFLPYVDNWAVCDIMSPKVLKKHKNELIHEIRKWASSKETYTCRFGLEMLMSHFLDDDYKPEYLEIAAAVKSEEYYVKMMVAWFFATALAKQWDTASAYIEERRLDRWTHNKTIQKAVESYRITDEQKQYLRSLKLGTDK